MSLLGYVGQRLLLTLPVVLGVLTAIFLIVRVLPGDPAQVALGENASPAAVHLMGRDTFGRDVLARVVYAGRISPVVGVVSVLLGGTLGTLLGLAAGYAGAWAESLLMRVVDVLMAFPSLLLGVAVLAMLGAGLDKLIVAIGLVLAPPFARLVHAGTLSLSRREFVVAARCLGAGHARILGRHILPNLLGETVVLASLLTAAAIRIEASLSFIGLGVPPPTPTWGNMVRDGAPVLLNAPWLSVFPGLAMPVTVLAFNLAGDGLRDALARRRRTGTLTAFGARHARRFDARRARTHARPELRPHQPAARRPPRLHARRPHAPPARRPLGRVLARRPPGASEWFRAGRHL